MMSVVRAQMIAGRPQLAARPLIRALSAVAAAVLVLVTTQLSVPVGDHPVDWLGVALVLVSLAATVLMLRWPLTGVTLVAVALGCYLGRHYPYGPILGVGLLAAVLAGWRADRYRALGAVALLEIAVVTGQLVADRDDVLVLLYPGWALAAALIGGAVRAHQRSRQAQVARAELLERSRQAEAAQQLVEHRLRIARDLHDGVAHAMAIITVQAAAAARVVDRHPAAAKSALDAIAQASRTVLDELNTVVAVLREDDRPAERTPTPGLADVADLIATMNGDALRCELDLRADPTRVRSVIGSAAYRIVQESLTNVLRHSAADHVAVSIAGPADGVLVVEICDDGPAAGTPSPGAGTGIAGMRERTEATGGTFAAGRHKSGYLVRAEWAGAVG